LTSSRQRRDPDRGQATVELALALPLVVLLLVGLVQAGLLVRDQILVVHAAREAVRAAAVDDDPAAVEQAAADAGPLDRRRLDVTVSDRGAPGSRVSVRVTYRARLRLPMLGPALDDVVLRASATMRVER
jgi:Flp pilus assembly protein TadG